ncbi:MAG: TetR/AcrR family transcriptional regulator [Agathobacter sp.]|nr:TetR/AcrR family transcriptional regulator [Agathobacter sp.]
MTSREQQAQQTYERILQTAESLLTSCSYEELSITEICEKAGVSKGGFYHHFSSKDQIIAILIGRQMQEYVCSRVAPLLGKKDAPALLEIYMQAGLDYLKNHPKDTLARCWLAMSHHKELASSHLSLLSYQLLQNILAQGIEENHFRKDIDPLFCANFIAATYTGITFHSISFDDDNFSNHFAKKSMELILQIIS